jgi:hypothetical protein
MQRRMVAAVIEGEHTPMKKMTTVNNSQHGEFHKTKNDPAGLSAMKRRVLGIAGAIGLALISGGNSAWADALSTPSIAGPLAANPNPYAVDLPDWLGPAGGKIYIDGAVTGLAYWQSNPTKAVEGDRDSYMDLSNAQVFIQKTDGWLQFYVQAGMYSLPTLGVPYVKASVATPADFGAVPVAYIKLAGQGDLSSFSLQAGKLPTLIGDEYTFTFQNMNIERGLLWNLEPAVSRGVQVNYANGPITVSLSLNDGTYSDLLNTLSGLASYAFNGGADTLSFAASGEMGRPYFSFLNSSNIYNLIYTHTSGPWTISPYMQYISTPAVVFPKGTDTWAGALLVSYSLDDNWKLAARGEYESSTGQSGTAPNLIGYGAGSNAWSLTLTPTYQWKLLYARGEFSYVGPGDVTPGDTFGTTGTKNHQVRLMLETGVLF